MNQLTTYSSDIKRLHMKAQRHAASAIQCAMEAGQLLIEAKSHVKHGGWLPFVESTGVNERTARNYMHLARNQDLLKSATVADMGVKKALEYLAEPKAEPDEYQRQLEVGRRILEKISDAETSLKVILIRMWGGSQKALNKLQSMKRRKGMSDDAFDSWCEENDYPSLQDLHSIISMETAA